MSNERQEKKEQFTAQPSKGGFGKMIAIVAVVAVLGAGAAFLLLGQGSSGGYASVKSDRGEVRIDLSAVDDGQAHFYKYATNQGDISFFVVKSVDGVIRAAFDTCDVCYREKKGYRQEGNFMVCNNCEQKFRTDLVNEVKGGCNPAPLQRHIDGKQLVINDQEILRGAWYFGG